MRRAAVIVALAAAGLTAAGPAGAADPQAFQTPSKNIRCMAFGGQLRCDMLKLGNKAAKKPASCEFDYGRSFGITKNGSRGRRLCVSDAVDAGQPVIAYGRTWKRGGFTCRVRESGLRCSNAKGHGFELRIGRQRLF